MTENEGDGLDEFGYSTNRQLLQGDTFKSSASASKSTKKKRNIMEDLINPDSKIKSKSNYKLKGKSLYICGPKNNFRFFIFKIVTNKFFDPFILSLILISTILLAVDNPLNDPNG